MAATDIKAGFETVQEYLEARAIPSDAFTMDKCHLSMLGTTEGWKLLGYKDGAPFPTDSRLALVIYFQHAHYYHVKWVGRPPRKDMGKVTGIAKRRCPCYIPPFIDWEQNNGTLYICESPLKAIAMSLRGYAAVASNGIWSMWCRSRDKSGKQEREPSWADGFPITAMDSINKIVILFDSDIQTKAKELGSSVRKLGDALQLEFPDKEIMERPMSPLEDGTDQGIDDAIAREGDQWLHDWLADPAGEHPVVASALHTHFDELNEEYCISRDKGEVIRISTGSRLSFYSTEKIEGNRLAMDGDKPVSAVKLWLQSDARNDVDRMAYVPGKDVLCEHNDERIYNVWYDNGVVPEDGSVEYFYTVYRNTIQNPEVFDLMMQSFAWMLQNRGSKLEKLFFFVGRAGSGKSFLAGILKEIFGERNAVTIGQGDLENPFNGSYATKELVVLDDLHKLGKEAMSKVKNLVTDPKIMVNIKMKPQYPVDNYLVFFVTSNELKALPLAYDDRRVFVIDAEPAVHYPDGSAWWNGLAEWCESGGIAALRYHLETMDLEGFSPNFMPPLTETKAHMTESSFSPEEQWSNDLGEDPDAMLPTLRSVYSTQELYMIYTSGQNSDRSNSKPLVNALQERFHQVADKQGKPVQIKQGKIPRRFWKIRDNAISVEDAKADVKKYPYCTGFEQR